MKKTVFISGYKGFIGRNLVKLLQQYPDEYLLRGYGRVPLEHGFWDLNNEILCNPPDVIVHLAANPLVKASYRELMRDNVDLTNQILSNLPSIRPEPAPIKFIFASSATVYGDLYNAAETDESNPTSVYGYTKVISENMINASALAGYVDPVILRFVANIGPHSTHGVLHDLIKKYHANDVLDIIGKYPGSEKPYTHVEDTIQAIKMGIDGKLSGTYNVGLDDYVSVDDIVDAIMDAFGEKARSWHPGECWKGDNTLVKINNKKIIEAGWIPKYKTSKEAINAVIRG